MTDVMSLTEDILEKVLNTIEADKLDDAVGIILGLKGTTNQVALVRQLNGSLIATLDRDRERKFASILDYAVGLDYTLASALALAFDLGYAIALSRPYPSAKTNVRVRALALGHALARARDIAYDLGSLERANLLDDKVNLVNQRVLEVIAKRTKDEWSDITEINERISLTFVGIDILTPQSLCAYVSPYLQALFDLKVSVDVLQGNEVLQPQIVSISQNSPITAVLDNLGKVVIHIWEDIMPWRRKHAQELANIRLAQESQVIAEKNVDMAAKRAQTEQEKIEIEKMRLDLEKQKIENDRLRLEYAQAKATFILKMMNEIAPNTSEVDKLEHLEKVTKAVDVLLHSPLELKTEKITLDKSENDE